MFLKKVYQHSKVLLAGMLFFMLLQVGINVKRGMVFSPFFHFGMYSAPQKPASTYVITTVMVNGDTLRGTDFTPQGWDKIHYNLFRTWQSRCDTTFFRNQISRLYQKAGLPVPVEYNFINTLSFEDRMTWYKAHVAAVTGHPNGVVTISRDMYHYRTGAFTPIQNLPVTPEMSEICP